MDLKNTVRSHAMTLLDRKTTKSMLCDVLNNDIPKVNAMMSAFDTGIISVIMENYPLDDLGRINAINKLINAHNMLESMSVWAVDEWISVVDKTVIEEIDKAKKLQEEERRLYIQSEEKTVEALDLPSSHEETIAPLPADIDYKSDADSFYTNVKLNKQRGKIFIPCGVGNTDYGFFICGIKELDCSVAPSVFAIVYNYLIRNSCIEKEDYPHYLNSIQTTYQLNYQNVYRLMIIILQLIKNNLIKSNIDINYLGKEQDLILAIEIINDYVSRFSRLMRSRAPVLKRVLAKKDAIVVSLKKKVNGVYIEENDTPCNARELWYGEKINYHLDSDLLPDLEYILGEISPYDTFKEGQFVALKEMLATNTHSMCIMPTGSGKSLIFYFASLLQPLPMFILAPTDILIDDQIRNLKKFHRIDNVSHLKLTSDNDFSKFEMCNSMMYLTPTTFQNRHLLVKCRYINNGHNWVYKGDSDVKQEITISPGPSISYVVLDEIHCLSNWGHDFRPEYLMLSKFLNRFLDRITFLGFTATANYTVVEDIQKQLNIPQNNIFSPIAFEKYNISYHFQSFNSFDKMIESVCEIVKEKVFNNERTIVFTKNDEISFKVANAIGYEADVFQKDNTYAYHLFADEKCKVLVASEELGIGINLPNVHNIIHFGLPVSKNEYVQEVGRAGRANEAVNSYVLYLDPNAKNIPPVLLKRELEIPNISQLLLSVENDYSACYRKFNGGFDSKDDLFDHILNVYNELNENGHEIIVKKYPIATVDMVKKYIFMLYTIGYVNDWYAYSGDERDGVIEIMVVLGRECGDTMLRRVKQRTVQYYESLGANREQIVKTQRASDIPNVIKVYVDWYYSKFLYHHKEMFLDFLDFAESNQGNDNDAITETIREYFTLPFVELKSDEAYYSKLTLREISEKVSVGIGRNTLANIERINSNKYSYNLDCFLLLGNLRMFSRFDMRRYERIINNTPNNQKNDFIKAITTVFAKLDSVGRLETIRCLVEASTILGDDPVNVANALYQNADKDIVYYGILASQINEQF